MWSQHLGLARPRSAGASPQSERARLQLDEAEVRAVPRGAAGGGQLRPGGPAAGGAGAAAGPPRAGPAGSVGHGAGLAGEELVSFCQHFLNPDRL